MARQKEKEIHVNSCEYDKIIIGNFWINSLCILKQETLLKNLPTFVYIQYQAQQNTCKKNKGIEFFFSAKYERSRGTNGTGKDKQEVLSLYTETNSESFATSWCIFASESFKHFLLSEYSSR